MALLAVAHELSSGAALNPEIGAKFGPEAVSETALAKKRMQQMPTGSVVLRASLATQCAGMEKPSGDREGQAAESPCEKAVRARSVSPPPKSEPVQKKETAHAQARGRKLKRVPLPGRERFLPLRGQPAAAFRNRSTHLGSATCGLACWNHSTACSRWPLNHAW